MGMIVFVSVKRQSTACAGAEQRPIFRRRRYDFGCAFATDMTIQTHHPVRRTHHDMQFVADHQNSTARALAHPFDLQIERRLSGLIKPLRRLVQ